MPIPTSEADIIFNRANVALAKSQRLVASWLPRRTEEELQNAKSAEEIEREEEEMFRPMPELLGLGATVPKDGDVKRQDLSSNDRLRKQLLGKDFAKMYGRSDTGGRLSSGVLPTGSKPRPTTAKRPVEDFEEDEGGRSLIGKSKRRKDVNRQIMEGSGDSIAETAAIESGQAERVSQPRKSSSYLDEVLADREQKKRKRKKQVVTDSPA